MAHCGECRYGGWKGLVKYCRHPGHVKPITQWEKKCPEFCDQDRKIMPGQEQPWAEPVRL
jgi:hypothetical protein